MGRPVEFSVAAPLATPGRGGSLAADGAASAEGDRLTPRSGAWKLERSSLKAMLVMDVSDEERDGVFR